jgi:beta-lactamase class A
MCYYFSMRKQIIIYIFALFVGLVIGFFVGSNSEKSNGNNLPNAKNSATGKNIEYRSGGYQFISPLLDCGTGQNLYQGQTAALKEKLAKYIQQQKDQNQISDVAVYFRDLRNGPWFGINEDTKFVPASLMKVPVMIAYYKMAESDPAILQKKIAVGQLAPETFEQSYKPSQNIESGKTYSIDELIYYMIAFSDNDALTLLLQNIDQNFLLKSYTDLGVIIPGAKSLDDELTVKEYSSFFRILYNASYLNPDYSEQALQVLSKSDFKNGIVAGFPENIQVSHKFGERFSISNQEQGSTEKQLHDCGIVYDPDHPYLICIMSKGDNFDELSKTIRDISQIIYENLDNN